ncbi:MAG: hypothetical protein WC156_16675 [Pedobacter sp.]
MKTLIVLLLALLIPSHVLCKPLLLKELKDKSISNLLGSIQVLSEYSDKNSAYFIRVFATRDYGECDGDLATCPKQSLLVLVSTRDEYPEQKVFTIPKAYEWAFVKYLEMPKTEGAENFAVIALKQKLKTDHNVPPEYQNCTLRVNLNKGELECR